MHYDKIGLQTVHKKLHATFKLIQRRPQSCEASWQGEGCSPFSNHNLQAILHSQPGQATTEASQNQSQPNFSHTATLAVGLEFPPGPEQICSVEKFE